MEIRNGEKYTFNTTDTELNKYNGSKVEIIRPLTEQECDIAEVGIMYKIRFEDGYESDSFEDELSKEDMETGFISNHRMPIRLTTERRDRKYESNEYKMGC